MQARVKLDLLLTDVLPLNDGKYAVHYRRDNILLFSARPIRFRWCRFWLLYRVQSEHVGPSLSRNCLLEPF